MKNTCNAPCLALGLYLSLAQLSAGALVSFELPLDSASSASVALAYNGATEPGATPIVGLLNVVLDVDVDTVAREATVQSIRFDGGNLIWDQLEVNFASGLDVILAGVGGTVASPGGASPVDASGNFAAAAHQGIIDSGLLVATGPLTAVEDFTQNPTMETGIGQAVLHWNKTTETGDLATYNVSLDWSFPVTRTTTATDGSGNPVTLNSIATISTATQSTEILVPEPNGLTVVAAAQLVLLVFASRSGVLAAR